MSIVHIPARLALMQIGRQKLLSPWSCQQLRSLRYEGGASLSRLSYPTEILSAGRPLSVKLSPNISYWLGAVCAPSHVLGRPTGRQKARRGRAAKQGVRQKVSAGVHFTSKCGLTVAVLEPSRRIRPYTDEQSWLRRKAAIHCCSQQRCQDKRNFHGSVRYRCQDRDRALLAMSQWASRAVFSTRACCHMSTVHQSLKLNSVIVAHDPTAKYQTFPSPSRSARGTRRGSSETWNQNTTTAFGCLLLLPLGPRAASSAIPADSRCTPGLAGPTEGRAADEVAADRLTDPVQKQRFPNHSLKLDTLSSSELE